MAYFHGPNRGTGKTNYNNDFLHFKVDSAFLFWKTEIMS